jgi:signal transduction histidine kinase
MDETDVSSNDDQKAMVEGIRASCDYMLQALNKLRTWVGSDKPASQSYLEATDLRAVVEQSVWLCRPLAARKEISVRFRPCEETTLLRLDQPKMLRLFVNLFGETIKHSLRGAVIDVSLVVGHTSVLITIEDDGTGIAALHWRSVVRGTRQESGLDLTLESCKRIVEQHGGKIWTESKPGTGSTFYVSLPADNESSLVEKGDASGQAKSFHACSSTR